MESTAGNLLAAIVDEEACPSQHLLGGTAGKGQEQNRPRVDPLLHQTGYAINQGAGLTGPRPGNHQQGPIGCRDRLILSLIELLLIIDSGDAAGR